MMNRSQFRKQLQLGLNTVFGQEYKRYPEEWKEIFDQSTSEKAYEEDVLMTGLGAAQIKKEGAAVSYDEGSEAWVARYYHVEVALAFAITETAVEDGLYGDLGAKFSKALARSMQHTKEILGVNVLNNAFSSSYTGGDGVALCSASHPLQGGGTASNTFASHADLSEASLEDALTAIGLYVDDRYIPIAAQGKKLIVPPALNFVAERLLQSQLRPGTADNDVNAILNKGMLPEGYTVNHRLTDPTKWFIKTDVPDGLKYFQRTELKRGMEGDFESGSLRYKARERFSFGFTDWRATFGSS
jgi:hypothetical protein